MFFLKVLLTEYLRLTGVDIYSNDKIIDSNSVINPEELENGFKKIPLGNILKGNKTGYLELPVSQFVGKLSRIKPCGVIQFKLDASKLKEVAKKYNTTVTGYLLSLIFLTGKSTINKSHGDLGVLLPVNVRKFYNTKNIRNYSLFCRVRLPMKKITNIETIISNINNQLKEKNTKEFMSRIIIETKCSIKFFKYIPLILKRTGAKNYYAYISSGASSTTFSNLGVVELPDNISKYIECMDFIINTSINNKVSCSVVTVNNITTFSISKMTTFTKFEEKFYELLYNDGLISVVEGSKPYKD